MTDSVVRLKRTDVIDTSGMTEIMIGIDPGAARGAGTMPDDLERLLGRVVMGQAVPRADLARWGVTVARLYRIDQMKGPPPLDD